jgi:hypothetical protein
MNQRRFFSLFFLFFSAILFARDIEVTVEDEDLLLPLEGAVVSLRGGAQFICNEDGVARVTLPDDRQTIITVSYPGYDAMRMTIPSAETARTAKFSAKLRLGGIMTSQELVIEAARPETSETKSGRSVAISERELSRTAEIGIVEDVMNSVKLLPGVGYTGMFNAMPSIRGGDPGDLMAALDGFYLERPYHWMGSISIFDPKMISAARLSHGVFSVRYGHTISGLLEVTSKTASGGETEMEAAIGSSATSINLSLPLWGKGGILLMGKVTYWDTLVLAAQGLSKVVEDETLDLMNSISTSPYIRSAAVSMNYRFTPSTEWRLNAFFGSDGVGAEVNMDYSQYADEGISGIMEAKADYNNYQGFLITGFNTSPLPTLSLRFTGGFGFIETLTEDNVKNRVTVHYNQDFLNKYPILKTPLFGSLTTAHTYTAPNVNVDLFLENTIFNTQLRTDADLDLGGGFIAAFGVQELYSVWAQVEDINLSFMEMPLEKLNSLSPAELAFLPPELIAMLPYFQLMPEAAIIIPASGYQGDVLNQGFTSSAYALLEYASPGQRFGAELGLRVDHLYFLGKDFGVQLMPALNPRLNLDFGILKNKGILDSLTATVGTGLFSSMNNLISFINKESGLEDFDMKFNRSWTSVVGFKFDFLQKFSFNIEGYYKYTYDRAYITADIMPDGKIIPSFNFDGIGNVYGFDLQLQKLESRYWDGWISYTWTWAKYFDPTSGDNSVSLGSTDSNSGFWYYPSFHRFHNCNIVVNFKPTNWFTISTRFGFASGRPREKIISDVYSYPVLYLNDNKDFVVIQKYRRDSAYDDDERSAWSLPLDIKLSFYPSNRKGRAGLEIYLAGENMLSLVYKPVTRSSLNQYTGKEDPDGGSGNFDLPIPMVSFGFKWRY